MEEVKRCSKNIIKLRPEYLLSQGGSLKLVFPGGDVGLWERRGRGERLRGEEGGELPS